MTASIAPCSRYLPSGHDPETIPERHPARITEREASLLCPPANGLHHQGLDAAAFAHHSILLGIVQDLKGTGRGNDPAQREEAHHGHTNVRRRAGAAKSSPVRIALIASLPAKP